MKATKKRGMSGKGVPLGESVEGPEPYAAAITTTTSNNNNGFTTVNTFARTKTSGSATAAGGASSLPVANSFAPGGAQPVYGFNSGALFFGLVKDNYCPTGRDDPLRNYGAFLWDRYFSQVWAQRRVGAGRQARVRGRQREGEEGRGRKRDGQRRVERARVRRVGRNFPQGPSIFALLVHPPCRFWL